MFRVLPGCIALMLASPAGTAPRLKDVPVDVYYPTTVGDRWVSMTQTRADSEDATETVTDTVTAVEKKDGAIFVSVGREVDGKISRPTSQVKLTDHGIFRVSTSGTVFDTPYQVLKLPLKAGAEWVTQANAGGGEATTFKYKAVKEENINVPAGKFRAFRVEVESERGGPGSHVTLWYAPRVGVVRQEYRGGNLTYVRVLKSFTPGK